MSLRISLCFLCFLYFCALPSATLWAQREAPAEEYSISAARIKTPLSESGSAVTVIGAAEIAQRGRHVLEELLRGLPGVDVVRSGGPGGNSSVFLRGSNSSQVLVLVDGVIMNNPIATERAFNFADITVDNIERIEILRGAQSTLYGSNAIGGVIAIYTKVADPGRQGQLLLEGGSYESFLSRLTGEYGGDQGGLAISLSRLSSGGISAADRRDGNSERDGYENYSAALRADYAAAEHTDLSLITRYHDARTDLDNFGGPGGDDPNRRFRNQQFFGRLQAESTWLTEELTQLYALSLNKQRQRDNNDTDELHPLDWQRSSFNGRLLQADWQNTWRPAGAHTLLFGAAWQEERGRSDFTSESVFGPFSSEFPERSARTLSLYLQDQFNWEDRLFVAGGLRWDHFSSFGSQVTWRVAPAWHWRDSGTIVRAAAATGFKAPSLFQLYSDYGSPNLDPEESLSLEAGCEQSFWEQRLQIGATYFYNNFDHLIDFDPARFVYENIAEARSSGVEAFVNLALTEYLRLRGGYTYTDTENEDTGAGLLRRPRNKYSLLAEYAPAAAAIVSAELIYTGSRADLDFAAYPPETVTLGGYTVVNLAARYALSKRLNLRLRAENVLDRRYQEVLGYGTLGAALYAGAEYAF